MLWRTNEQTNDRHLIPPIGNYTYKTVLYHPPQTTACPKTLVYLALQTQEYSPAGLVVTKLTFCYQALRADKTGQQQCEKKINFFNIKNTHCKFAILWQPILRFVKFGAFLLFFIFFGLVLYTKQQYCTSYMVWFFPDTSLVILGACGTFIHRGINGPRSPW